MTRGVLLVLLSVFAAAPGVFAQAEPPRGRVGGVFGSGRTWDDEGSLGTGIVAGGRVEWRLFGNTGIEGAVEILTHDRSGGFFQAEGESAMVSASLVHRFGSDTVQPYILEGVSLVRHAGTTRFDTLRFDRKSTDPGFHVGGGLAIRVGERVDIGPEARFYFIRPTTGSDPALAYWIGGRIGVRF